MSRWLSAICTLALAAPGAALAQETTTFSYDALGRVIESESVRTNGPDTTHGFGYDDADNRTTATVTQTGSFAAPPAPPSADADRATEPPGPPVEPEG